MVHREERTREVADLRHAGDDGRVLGNALAQRPEDRRVGLLGHEAGDFLADLLALGLLRGAGLAAGAEALEKRLERGLRVAHEPRSLLVIAPDLVDVGVDLDHLLIGREHRQHAPAADREDDVGRVEVPTQRALREEAGAEREIAGVADRALAFRGLDDAGLEVLGDGGERRVRAREIHAPTHIDGDSLRTQQRFRRAVDIGRGCRGGRRVRADRRQGHVNFFLHRVPGHVDGDGPRTPASKLSEGLVDDAGRVGDLHDGLTPLRRARDGVELVVELVEHAELLADLVARDLSRDHQDPRRGRVRGVQSGRRVQQTGSGHGHRDADAAAGARVSIGHVGRRAFVAHGDESDRLVAKRGDDAVELNAGKPERHLHALAGQRLHDRFTTGHPCHRRLLT